MTKEQRLALLKQIEKQIYVPSSKATLQDELKSVAILSIIDEEIERLEQEPKTGRWIRYDNGKYHWYLCSCCDAMAGSDEKMMAYKYCLNCGAKMVKPQESEDKE